MKTMKFFTWSTLLLAGACLGLLPATAAVTEAETASVEAIASPGLETPQAKKDKATKKKEAAEKAEAEQAKADAPACCETEVAKAEATPECAAEGATAEVATEAPAAPAPPQPEPDEFAELKKEIERMRLIKTKMELEAGLEMEEVKRDVANLTYEKIRLDAQQALMQARLETELADIKSEVAILTHQKNKQALEVGLRIDELKLADAEMKAKRAEIEFEAAMLSANLARRAKQDEWSNFAEGSPAYLLEPLVGKDLIISDRRIELNGPIYGGTADHVTERINYFNNKNTEFPIFIVIDSSPGGSVMSGYRILKAMEGSDAPVYVVVKSFAASMAACITTLAERSYVYPNAIILHHQMSYGMMGNMTVHKEQFDSAREWFRRLATPVAKKMGMSLEQFVKKMYENNSEGDWEEFGDRAVRLKWADYVVDDIRETSLLKNPDASSALPRIITVRSEGNDEKRDEQGRRYLEMPRLEAFDYWWIYNPDNYYR